MNVQAHMSGQIAGQLPNQAGTQLAGVPQQNESPFSNQIQNLGGHHNTMYMDPQLVKARRFMQEKIYELLIQRLKQTHDRHSKQFQDLVRCLDEVDLVRRLDEVLYRNAASKEEYMSLETLETRLHALIKRSPISNRNQQHPQLINSASPIATMIPTPWMTHSGNLMVTSTVDASMVASSGGTGIAPATSVTEGLLPTTNGISVGMPSGSFNSSDGSMSNGLIQSLSEFSISPGGSLVSSSGVRGMTSQMIPTPGFNSSNTQSFMNLESSNDTGAFSTIGSSTISPPLPQK